MSKMAKNNILLFSLKHYLLSKILIISVIYFTLLISLPITNEAIPLFNFDKAYKAFKIIFETADTGWYQEIALNGYFQELYNMNRQRNWAFFPLFPILLNLINNDYIIWLILQFAIVFSGVFIYKIAKYHFSEDIAKWSVIYFIFWPWTYIQSSLRPEAILLLFWLVSYYLFLNKNYFSSSFFAFLSALLKPNGFLISFLAFLYIIKFYKEDTDFKYVNYIKPTLVVVSGPIGVMIYSIYIYDITGDFLSWAKIQSAWGSEFLAQPIRQFIELVSSPMFIDRWGWDLTFFNWISFIMFVFLMIKLFQVSPILSIFAFVVSFLSIVNFGVWVHGRHLSTIFPLFLALSWYFKTDNSRFVLLNIFIVCMTMFAIFNALGINAFRA